MKVFGTRTPQLPEAKLDFIAKLPLEVSQLIFRKLDPKSLVCATQVSQQWMEVCQSDCRLKRTMQTHKSSMTEREGNRKSGYYKFKHTIQKIFKPKVNGTEHLIADTKLITSYHNSLAMYPAIYSPDVWDIKALQDKVGSIHRFLRDQQNCIQI